MKTYREVKCSDRLPDKADMYIVGFGSAITQARWYPKITHWVFNQYDIEWWLEELPPTDSAQERYDKALKLLKERKSDRPHPTVVVEWLKIAAGLKD